MDDQPRGASRRWFPGPTADHIRRRIAQEAGDLGNTDLGCGGFELDERIIAAERDVCAFQGFSHEEWTRGARRACEGDDVVSGQSTTSFGDSRLRQIPSRCIEREAHLSELATNEVGSNRARKSDREIGIATRYVERTNAQGQVD